MLMADHVHIVISPGHHPDWLHVVQLVCVDQHVLKQLVAGAVGVVHCHTPCASTTWQLTWQKLFLVTNLLVR